jgi:hypothetical protein
LFVNAWATLPFVAGIVLAKKYPRIRSCADETSHVRVFA